MTTPYELGDAPDQSFNDQALAAVPPDEDAGPLSLFQEINERRARVENAELLAHLRGL